MPGCESLCKACACLACSCARLVRALLVHVQGLRLAPMRHLGMQWLALFRPCGFADQYLDLDLDMDLWGVAHMCVSLVP
jgi:hypothetical protein